MEQSETETAEKKPAALPEWKCAPVPQPKGRDVFKCELGNTTIRLYPKNKTDTACISLDTFIFDSSAAPDINLWKEVALGLLVREMERVLPIIKQMIQER